MCVRLCPGPDSISVLSLRYVGVCVFFRMLGVDFVLLRRSRCSYSSLRSWAVKLQVMAAEAREAEQTSQESFEVLAPTLKMSQWIFVASLALQVIMM